jgi:hypothetical protein
VTWEQAWELLSRMAGNPECLEIIQLSLLRCAASNTELHTSIDKDAFDSHLSGLLQKILHVSYITVSNRIRNMYLFQTAIGEYQASTPTYRKTNKQQLIGLLSSMVAFCMQFMHKSDINRHFASLNTLNKVRI